MPQSPSTAFACMKRIELKKEVRLVGVNAGYSDLSRALVARMFEGAALTDFTCLDQSFQRILQSSSGDFPASLI